MADSIASNIPVIQDHSESIINAEVVGKVEKYLSPLQEAFERLDKKRDDTAPPTQE